MREYSERIIICIGRYGPISCFESERFCVDREHTCAPIQKCNTRNENHKQNKKNINKLHFFSFASLIHLFLKIHFFRFLVHFSIKMFIFIFCSELGLKKNQAKNAYA